MRSFVLSCQFLTEQKAFDNYLLKKGLLVETFETLNIPFGNVINASPNCYNL